MTLSVKTAIVGAIAWLAASSGANAAIILTSDKGDFLSDTGATSATGAIPIAGSGASSMVVGSVTISAESPSTLNFTQDWTDRIAGNQFAINGVEDVTFDFGEDVFAFGFDFVEPEFDPLVNAPFVDSTFEISFCDDGTCFDSIQISAPNDVAYFIGLISDIAFDTVVISEIIGAAENEFFGEIYTSTDPVSDVPLPAAAPLFLAGLAGAGLFGRRRATKRQ